MCYSHLCNSNSKYKKTHTKKQVNEKNLTNIQNNQGENKMPTNKINMEINEIDYEVTLENNETVKSLLEKLPLEINMLELNGNEKYYYLDETLPNNPKQVGQIEMGDIMLYENDCLVIFYDSFKTPYSYTKIGKINNPTSLKKLSSQGSVKVKITK